MIGDERKKERILKVMTLFREKMRFLSARKQQLIKDFRKHLEERKIEELKKKLSK